MTGAVPSPLPGSAHPASALPASALPASALRAEGVWKAFGERPVLRGVSVSLAAHEVVALIGASGSGKSTLLRCINHLENYQKGEIRVGGTRLGDDAKTIDAVRREVGMVFQHFNLLAAKTVRENVTDGVRGVA